MGFVNSIFNLFRFNKGNWKSILLCVFAATVFWFFNSLNKNYAANIGFEIEFDYDQAKYIPVKSLPEEIRLNVSGNGWNLFRKSAGLKVPPLIIPLERPAEVKKIVGSSLPPILSTQMEGLQINFVLTDTIYLDINPRAKRMLKLSVDSVQRHIQRNYGVSSPVIIVPDSVLVEGPESIVEGLPGFISLTLPDDRIRSHYNDVVEIALESAMLIPTPPFARVTFSVETLSEVTHTRPLRLLHVPEHVRLSLEADQITLTFLTPSSGMNAINPDSIYAVIDMQQVPKGNHKMVPRIVGLPPFSHILKIDTVAVSY